MSLQSGSQERDALLHSSFCFLFSLRPQPRHCGCQHSRSVFSVHTTLKTVSQTHPEVCLLGDSQPFQANITPSVCTLLRCFLPSGLIELPLVSSQTGTHSSYSFCVTELLFFDWIVTTCKLLNELLAVKWGECISHIR